MSKQSPANIQFAQSACPLPGDNSQVRLPLSHGLDERVAQCIKRPVLNTPKALADVQTDHDQCADLLRSSVNAPQQGLDVNKQLRSLVRVRNLILRLALPNPWRPEIPVDNVMGIEDDHFALDAFRIRYPEVDSGKVNWAIKEPFSERSSNGCLECLDCFTGYEESLQKFRV